MKKSTKTLIIIVAAIAAVCVIFSIVYVITNMIIWSPRVGIDTDDYCEYSYNIHCIDKMRVIKKKINKTDVDILPWIMTYSRIKGVPTDEFVFLSERRSKIMKHKDFDGALTVSADSAKLLLTKRSVPFDEDDSPAEKLAKQEIAQIDAKLVESVVAELNSQEPAYVDFENGSPRDVYSKYNGVLQIKFSIEEYENLIWKGNIYKLDQTYFIGVTDPSGTYRYLSCGEELSAMIDGIVEEYDLKEGIVGY